MPTILPFGTARLARLLPALVAALLAPPAAGTGTAPASSADGWVAFEATWSAAGQRRALRAGDREAATVHLSGAFVVEKGEGLRRGFRGEAIGFDDGRGSGAGTLVLTDDHGDQVFCDLVGATSERGRVIEGTIRGGTGAYAGISGDLSFRWRHVVRTPEGDVQGVSVDLKGRYRRGPVPTTPASAAPAPGAPR